MSPIQILFSILKRELKKETVTNEIQLIESLIDIWHGTENIQICIKKNGTFNARKGSFFQEDKRMVY